MAQPYDYRGQQDYYDQQAHQGQQAYRGYGQNYGVTSPRRRTAMASLTQAMRMPMGVLPTMVIPTAPEPTGTLITTIVIRAGRAGEIATMSPRAHDMIGITRP